MIPIDIFAEDLMNAVVRYGLYIGAVFQLACLLACITVTDEEYEPYPYEKVALIIATDHFLLLPRLK